jgi:hypothetical protein
MLGPSLGLGGERVASHEGRNSNGSALSVVQIQHTSDEISSLLESRASYYF